MINMSILILTILDFFLCHLGSGEGCFKKVFFAIRDQSGFHFDQMKFGRNGSLLSGNDCNNFS